jgi:hypothetical protein
MKTSEFQATAVTRKLREIGEFQAIAVITKLGERNWGAVGLPYTPSVLKYKAF